MRKKILAIIACALCLVLIAGVYVLANQGSRDSYTCYEVSVEVGGETFRGKVNMYETWCPHGGGEPYSWGCGIYVNDQQKALQGYGYSKCPPCHEVEDLLKNSITLIKDKGDKKVFTIEDRSRKEYKQKVIYTLGDGKFYSYSSEKRIVKVIDEYKAGKRKQKNIDYFFRKMKKYKEIVPRHKVLRKTFPGLYELNI